MTPAASRMRRYRARQKAGRIVVPLDVPEIELSERLIEAGLLDPCQADDRTKLRQAIARVVELWCGDA